jgi:hypothetical protein
MPKKGTNGERPGRAAKKPPVSRVSCLCTDKAVHPACPLHRPPARSERVHELKPTAAVEDQKPPTGAWTGLPEPPKPAPPSQGSFKWLDSCPVTGCPRLRIRSVLSDGSEVLQTYDVEQQPSSCRLWFLKTEWTTDLDGRRIRSVRLKHYTVTFGKTWTCSCPDFAHRVRDGGCKHVRALRKALAALPF